jgi:hypothetical protein
MTKDYIYKKSNETGTWETHYIETRKCDSCGVNNIIIDRYDVHNTGYGSHTDRNIKRYLAGGRVEGLLVCDACRTVAGRLRRIKELQSAEKKLLRNLNSIKEMAEKVISEIEQKTS